MPRQTDLRTKSGDALTFYVFDDLEKKDEAEIYRYDTVEEAIEKFRNLPKESMSAIGVNINEFSSVDLIQRIGKEAVKVMDYLNMDVFSKRTDVADALDKLQDRLHVSYEYVSGVHPRCSVLAPVEVSESMDPYFNNKVLYISPRTHSQAMYASINELYIEGKGWVEAMDFLRRYPDRDSMKNKMPVIARVNISYKETDTGYLGQCDLSPQEFVQMRDKTKEHNLSFVDKKPTIERLISSHKKDSLDDRIKALKKSQEKKTYTIKEQTHFER